MPQIRAGRVKRFIHRSTETEPAPAMANHRNSAKYSDSSNPTKVRTESTWSHLAEAIATIMVTPSAPAEIRVRKPIKRNIPPKNSTPETKGARISGAGICQPTKFSVMAGKLCNFPQPLHKNSQPTMNRAKSGASHSRCRETRSGHSKNQSIRVFISFLYFLDQPMGDRLGVRVITPIG